MLLVFQKICEIFFCVAKDFLKRSLVPRLLYNGGKMHLILDKCITSSRQNETKLKAYHTIPFYFFLHWSSSTFFIVWNNLYLTWYFALTALENWQLSVRCLLEFSELSEQKKYDVYVESGSKIQLMKDLHFLASS